MAAEPSADVYHFAPRCLLQLFHAAAAGLANWSVFDAEAERWGRRGAEEPWPSTAVLLAARPLEVWPRPIRGPYSTPRREHVGVRSLIR